MSYEMSASRRLPVPPAEAMAAVLPMPLEDIFDRRFAALPPIVRTEGDQPWGTVGQSRTITLADRSTMRETLTEVEPPSHFGYRIDRLRGPLMVLARSVDGRWSFQAQGSGCLITWTWTVHPHRGPGGLAAPVLRPMWTRYAQRGLERIEQALRP